MEHSPDISLKEYFTSLNYKKNNIISLKRKDYY